MIHELVLHYNMLVRAVRGVCCVSFIFVTSFSLLTLAGSKLLLSMVGKGATISNADIGVI